MKLRKHPGTELIKKRGWLWYGSATTVIVLIITIVFLTQKGVNNLNLFEVTFESNDLETIDLNINFKDIQKIEKKRKEAIKLKRLISNDSDFINASVSFNEQNYRCKIRLKGVLPDHWSGDKISLRVEMKDGELIKGMSRFSLQDPSTRNEISEYLFLNHLTINNCMALKYDFVNVRINGKDKGIFAIEEHFSKEFIESNKRREGVIVKFDDTLVWHKYKTTNINRDSVFRTLPVAVRSKKKVERNPSLSKQGDNAVNLVRAIQENSLPASSVFDPVVLGKFIATVRIWGAEHCLELDDINFYFNPLTTKLEPIGFDGLAGRYPETPYCYFTGGHPRENWVNYALKDKQIAKEYIKYLERYSSIDVKSLFHKDIIAKEKKVRNLRLKEILINYPGVFLRNYDRLSNLNPWKNPFSIQKQITKELETDLLISCYAKPTKNSALVAVTIKNATTQPILVSHFDLNGEILNAYEHCIFPKFNKLANGLENTNIILNSQGSGFGQTSFDHKFLLQLAQFESNESNTLTVSCKFLGLSSYKTINIPLDSNNFDKLDQPNRPHLLPETIYEENNTIIIPKGNHYFTNHVVVANNKRLQIDGGANLFFNKESALISHGPMEMNGTPHERITLTSTSSSFPGIYLHSVLGESHVKYVDFSNVSGIGTRTNPNGIELNGWDLTGGITTYKSKVHFQNCSFRNFTTEDALNVISSSFSLQDTNFSDISSDAFDGDFVNGSISGCHFSNISGDGVDFSGSVSTVKNCFFNTISDKALSVGENSQVKIIGCSIDNSPFGIVSKDYSSVQVYRSTVINAKTAAFAAFQKKNSFGPASIKVLNPQNPISKQNFLIQIGSSGWLNGTRIASIPFKSQDLYLD